MSLLGIDIGTTGCKVAVFTVDGRLLSFAYREYDLQRPSPGWAELDAPAVWEVVKLLVRQAAQQAGTDPVQALSVSSLGEAVVPVSAGRQILGPSIINFDIRGDEFLSHLAAGLSNDQLYRINGNTLGNYYSLTKLMWVRDHQPDLFRQADSWMLWGSLITYMLGAEPSVDYSLANRTLLFDVDACTWSNELLDWAGLEVNKLPTPVPSGVVVGKVSQQAASELGLLPGTVIVSGAHDQCANATGCGVIQPGLAVYGMGTYHCITPVFSPRKDPSLMLTRGLNTEHHSVPDCYASFIYNQGGSLVKWYRDNFAAADNRLARETGQEIYPQLISEIPIEPSSVFVLPHFAVTGPPEFIPDSAGVIAGLKLETQRGDILKAIMEGVTFYLKECVNSLPAVGIDVNEYRAVGGGSKSDTWIQLCADILDRPFVRPVITEAGALGAAIMAGVGCGVFSSYGEGTTAMVHLERTFEPDIKRSQRYAERFELYREMGPIMREYLQKLNH